MKSLFSSKKKAAPRRKSTHSTASSASSPLLPQLTPSTSTLATSTPSLSHPPPPTPQLPPTPPTSMFATQAHHPDSNNNNKNDNNIKDDNSNNNKKKTDNNDNNDNKNSNNNNNNNNEPTTIMESILETTSTKLTDGTKTALSSLTNLDIVGNYFTPVIRYFYKLYYQQPEWSVERLGMLGVLVAGALPVACLVVGLGMMCMGCFAVCGSFLFLIEMFCIVFAGCVLAPAGLFAALTMGLPSLVLYGLYSSVSFLFSFF